MADGVVSGRIIVENYGNFLFTIWKRLSFPQFKLKQTSLATLSGIGSYLIIRVPVEELVGEIHRCNRHSNQGSVELRHTMFAGISKMLVLEAYRAILQACYKS